MAAMDFAALKDMQALLNQNLSDRLPADAGGEEREAAAVPCHVGQPVKVGVDGALLRICIGARQVIDVASAGHLGAILGDRLACQSARLRLAVRKIELVAARSDWSRSDGVGLPRHLVG
jgi:hypothetical protein